MAATVPFRYTDLLHKYGWDIMPRLSALGINNLAEAQILFVDSGATNATDADDGVHGHSLVNPLATIDYAVGLCTASEQSIILVAPGHAETEASAAALVTCDVAGVKILGMGEGTLRPTITLSTDTGAIAFSVTAANVVISNIKIVPTVNAVVKCISVAASDCKLVDIEVADTDATHEAAIGILTTTAADRLHVERYFHNGFLAGASCTEAIRLVGIEVGTIKDSWFRGAFSTAAIQMVTTACGGVAIEGCVFENGTTALSLDVVDNAASKWSAIDCFDVVGSYRFSGGSGAALAADDVSSVMTQVNKIDSLTLGTPVSNSLASFIASGGTGLGQKLPASTSLVDVIGNYTGPYNGAAADDNIKSQVDLLRAEVNKIDSVTLDTTPTAASMATFVAGGAGGIGTQLPTTTSLYDTTKNVNTVGVTGAPVASTLADTLHKDGSFTYDNTTDSLEAISDKITTGTDSLSGINVDHLAKTACADITDPADMSAEVADNTVLANVLTVEGDTSDYDRRYYSLQALAKTLQLYMGYELKSVPGSAMPIAIWFVDANIAASGDGKTPLTAFKTMAEAITVCDNAVDDWVLVFDYPGGGGTITIDKAFVHIIGNANPAMPNPRIKPASAVPGFTLGDSADRVEIANLTIGGGDQTVAAILIDSAAGAYGNHIHDCVIGRDADAPGLYGIHIPSGSAAPYLVVDNNRFYGADGAGIAEAGSAIRIEGNATRCRISNNYIQDIGRTATPAIWLDGEVTNPQIENNRIKTDTDTGTGSAITLGASVDDGWIAGNWASDGKDAPAQNPFVDAGSTNGWAQNVSGIVAVLPA